MIGSDLTSVILHPTPINMSFISFGSIVENSSILFDGLPTGGSGRTFFRNCLITGAYNNTENWPSVTFADVTFENVEFVGNIDGFIFAVNTSGATMTNVTFTGTVNDATFAENGITPNPGYATLNNVLFAQTVSNSRFAGSSGVGIDGVGATLTNVTFASVVVSSFAEMGGMGPNALSGRAILTNVIFGPSSGLIFNNNDMYNGGRGNAAKLINVTFGNLDDTSFVGSSEFVDLTTTIFNGIVTRTYFYSFGNECVYDTYPISSNYVRFAQSRNTVMGDATNRFRDNANDLPDPKYWNYLPAPPSPPTPPPQPVPPPPEPACFSFATLQKLHPLLPDRYMKIIGPRTIVDASNGDRVRTHDDSIGKSTESHEDSTDKIQKHTEKPMEKSFMFIGDEWTVVSFTTDHPFIVDGNVMTYAELLDQGTHAIPLGPDTETKIVYNVVLDRPLKLSKHSPLMMLGATTNMAPFRCEEIDIRLRVLGPNEQFLYSIQW